MVSLEALIAFVPIAALIIAVPGPSVLFTIGRALAVGRASALRTVIGNGLGLLVQGLVIACGVGALMSTLAWALTALKIGGGLYLVWLGIQALSAAEPTDDEVTQRRPGSDLRTGFVLGVSNPKTLVFLTALLPQFVPATADPVPQMLALSAVFAVLAILGDTVWALSAAQARAWFGRSAGRMRLLQRGGGLVLIGLGAWTLASGQAKG